MKGRKGLITVKEGKGECSIGGTEGGCDEDADRRREINKEVKGGGMRQAEGKDEDADLYEEMKRVKRKGRQQGRRV